MSRTMKAIAVQEKGVVKVVHDVPVPVPGDYEALVKVKACGFCNGTDMQIINNTMGEHEGMGRYPTILGHEGAGEVVEVGAKVRYIKPGDRFLHPNLRPEVGNGYTKTFGGMAQFGLVADHRAMLEDGYKPSELPFVNKFGPLPADFDFVDAGVLLSLNESLSAAHNFGCDPTKDVLVYGAGPMGLALMTYMRILGVRRLVAIDAIEERLATAVRLAKVDQTINFTRQDVDEALNGALFDIVVDAVGSTRVLMEGSHRLKQFGRLGSMGVLKNTDCVIDASHLKNNTLLHMLNFPYGEYQRMEENIGYIRQGLVNPKDFYSHVLPMDRIDDVLELVRNRQAFKVIMTVD